jgi:hypothetical protein
MVARVSTDIETARMNRSWQRFGSKNVWTFRHEPAVDFCIWALVQDGLSAPPFTDHLDGDGRLRTAGMDAETWSDWLAETVSLGKRHRALSQGLMESVMSRLPDDPEAEFPDDPHLDADIVELQDGASPIRAWHGNHAVRGELEELWPAYWGARREGGFNAFSITRHGSGVFGLGVGSLDKPTFPRATYVENNGLWKCFRSTRYAEVYTVRYPVHTYHVVAPGTVVIGTITADYLAPDFVRTLTTALESLDDRPPHDGAQLRG